MAGKKFDVDKLEERIAPSSLDIGSLADSVGNLASSGNSIGDGQALGNDTAHLLSGNSSGVSTGHIGSGDSAANGTSVDVSHAASSNAVNPMTNPNVSVSPNISSS